ncbi:VWA domain-containing protein [Nocardia elegans]|uniref:VWA domain-containing protein n=1 Tax=Nocardia elegans TaxID=300029 RepID=A0ABW6TN72_9NOCA|nr:vWA domain-containing protein [Nocardia elegans]MBF6446601.1 VWA domain-containing protein [Nocardia elegans]
MSQGITYAVDLVLCIDETGSMYSIIDRVKKNALAFSDDLRASLKEKGKEITDLRIRVIGFRDFYHDGDRSIEASDFYTLPEENTKFNAFVSGLKADGGGDEPETGLEALAIAVQSDWARGALKNRQVIVVWTDASAHPLDKDAGSKPPAYPSTMPKDLDELTDWWEGQEYVNHNAKRLILFAPDSAGWSEIGNNWSQTILYPSEAGAGLADHEYTTILDAIANSV